MAASKSMFKKSALILMYMARDLFLTDIGEKIPTINEYTDRFQVSRGIVQQALEKLTEDESIVIEKRGVLGSYLMNKNDEKLCTHGGWDSVTGSMPIPLTQHFVSLVTGICEELSSAPIPFSFAYMSGSVKRAEALLNGVYDFMIVSKSSAINLIKENEDLSICTELTDSQYCREFMIYFMNPEKSQIEDGMRVGVDPVCKDQKILTDKLCSGKKVEFVEFPFIGFEEIIRTNQVDCVVFRDSGERAEENKFNFRKVPVKDIDGLEYDDTITPVVVVRSDNYGVDRLMNKYLDAKAVSSIQKEVLDGIRTMKFY